LSPSLSVRESPQRNCRLTMSACTLGELHRNRLRVGCAHLDVRPGFQRPFQPRRHRGRLEVGIAITSEFPKPWTDEIVQAADVVVTMGCGDACPFFPGKRYENWELPDPAGQSVDEVRPIRDDIEERVRRLLDELGITADEREPR